MAAGGGSEEHRRSADHGRRRPPRRHRGRRVRPQPAPRRGRPVRAVRRQPRERPHRAPGARRRRPRGTRAEPGRPGAGDLARRGHRDHRGPDGPGGPVRREGGHAADRRRPRPPARHRHRDAGGRPVRRPAGLLRAEPAAARAHPRRWAASPPHRPSSSGCAGRTCATSSGWPCTPAGPRCPSPSTSRSSRPCARATRRGRGGVRRHLHSVIETLPEVGSGLGVVPTPCPCDRTAADRVGQSRSHDQETSHDPCRTDPDGGRA